jgi:hypothetical protein
MTKKTESIILWLIIGGFIVPPILLGLLSLFPSLEGEKNLGKGLYLQMTDMSYPYYQLSYTGRLFGSNSGYGHRVIPHPPYDDSYICKSLSNKEWIILKGIKENNDDSWFLIQKDFNLANKDWEKENCDSIIQSYITSFDDSLAFIRALEEKGIDLRFSDE